MVETSNTLVKFLNGENRLVTEPIPQPSAGEVLVRIHYSTVNPIDRHPVRIEGRVMVSDGSGVIESVGEGVPTDLIGKKVSFKGNSYANYKLSDVKSLVILHDSQDLRLAANAIVNPFTAFAL